jgi:hypothetical protein
VSAAVTVIVCDPTVPATLVHIEMKAEGEIVNSVAVRAVTTPAGVSPIE